MRPVSKPVEAKSREPSTSATARAGELPGSATTRGRPETAARRSIRKGPLQVQYHLFLIVIFSTVVYRRPDPDPILSFTYVGKSDFLKLLFTTLSVYISI